MQKRLLIWLLLCCWGGLTAQAQTRLVSGTVSSAEEGPLPGVNVILKGTTTGTTTDSNGKFSISVPTDEAVLTFSSIGFATDELTVGNRSTLDFTLKTDTRALSEVVVTAFGVKKEVKSPKRGPRT
jgi:hypothetical protein